MAYFLYQSALVTTIAFITGVILGWWFHHYSKNISPKTDTDLGLVKDYLAESIKENARLKIQLKHSEEKLDKLSTSENIVNVSRIDFDAFQAFEDTVKEVKMRKYLN